MAEERSASDRSSSSVSGRRQRQAVDLDINFYNFRIPDMLNVQTVTTRQYYHVLESTRLPSLLAVQAATAAEECDATKALSVLDCRAPGKK